jgi:hypothetical protein
MIMKKLITYLFAVAYTLSGLYGCTTIAPRAPKAGIEEATTFFSHDAWDRVLQAFVDEHGRVDYSGLLNNPEDLNEYYALIASYSPDSHPNMFTTRADRLAYWLNAYNAAVMKTVVSYYPISSVKDVKKPRLFFFLPDISGFFLFQKPVLGRQTISLYSLENKVIRKRFNEPRIHFALNCASRGCPVLSKEAYSAQWLDDQLDKDARRFFADPRNILVDHDQQIINLSSILDWFEKDFVQWQKKAVPMEEASLRTYIARYVHEDQVPFILNPNYLLYFVSYDWGLNDMATHGKD